MNLTIRVLGWELINVSTDGDEVACEEERDDYGDCTTQPIGFGGYHGDQRYEAEPGIDYT